MNDNIDFILSIFKFNLKDFMSNYDLIINYIDEDNLASYKEYYAMDVLVNDMKDKLLFNINKNEDKYLINVRSMSKIIPNTIISIAINNNLINVQSKVLFKDIKEETNYEFNDGSLMDTKKLSLKR